jgi:hypothetical protein
MAKDAEPMTDTVLDLAHLQRVAAILDGIPSGTDLPHALIALEDAYVCCSLALGCGLSLERAREIHQHSVTREEARRMLAEQRR